MLIDSSAAFARRHLGTAPSTVPGQESSPPVLPVLPALAGLLPWGGLRRGAAVEIGTSLVGQGRAPGRQQAMTATSLLLALLAGPSQAGSWCVVVGMPDLGLLAACEAGVELSRLALVPTPGDDWVKAVAALVDGFDVVVVRPPTTGATSVAADGRRATTPRGHQVALAADGRRLAARARHRGAVLVCLGDWPGAEVRLTATARHWVGADDGHGHLTARQVAVRAQGRGAAARPRQATLWLPTLSGAGEPFAVAEPDENLTPIPAPGALAPGAAQQRQAV